MENESFFSSFKVYTAVWSSIARKKEIYENTVGPLVARIQRTGSISILSRRKNEKCAVWCKNKYMQINKHAQPNRSHDLKIAPD